MKTIYLAGAIAGKTYEQATKWRRYCVEKLVKKYYVISPINVDFNSFGTEELTFDSGGADDCPFTIFHRDIDSVNKSDIIFAYIDTPSFGTGFELGYAYSLNKDIITVTSDKMKGHPFIEVPSSYSFDTIEQAVNYLLNT